MRQQSPLEAEQQQRSFIKCGDSTVWILPNGMGLEYMCLKEPNFEIIAE